MKVAKGTVLLLACLAIVLSIAPVTAQTDYQDYTPGGGSGGGGNNVWNVTCTYDGQEHLTGKVCNTGGAFSCHC
jgi:hypothetical protein